MQEMIKDSGDVKKGQSETFNSLDKAFDDLKNMVDSRKQRLMQLKAIEEERRHPH